MIVTSLKADISRIYYGDVFRGFFDYAIDYQKIHKPRKDIQNNILYDPDKELKFTKLLIIRRNQDEKMRQHAAHENEKNRLHQERENNQIRRKQERGNEKNRVQQEDIKDLAYKDKLLHSEPKIQIVMQRTLFTNDLMNKRQKEIHEKHQKTRKEIQNNMLREPDEVALRFTEFLSERRNKIELLDKAIQLWKTKNPEAWKKKEAWQQERDREISCGIFRKGHHNPYTDFIFPTN